MSIDPTLLTASITSIGTTTSEIMSNLLTVAPMLLAVAGFSLVFRLVRKTIKLR